MPAQTSFNFMVMLRSSSQNEIRRPWFMGNSMQYPMPVTTPAGRSGSSLQCLVQSAQVASPGEAILRRGHRWMWCLHPQPPWPEARISTGPESTEILDPGADPSEHERNRPDDDPWLVIFRALLQPSEGQRCEVERDNANPPFSMEKNSASAIRWGSPVAMSHQLTSKHTLQVSSC